MQVKLTTDRGVCQIFDPVFSYFLLYQPFLRAFDFAFSAKKPPCPASGPVSPACILFILRKLFAFPCLICAKIAAGWQTVLNWTLVTGGNCYIWLNVLIS